MGRGNETLSSFDALSKVFKKRATVSQQQAKTISPTKIKAADEIRKAAEEKAVLDYFTKPSTSEEDSTPQPQTAVLDGHTNTALDDMQRKLDEMQRKLDEALANLQCQEKKCHTLEETINTLNETLVCRQQTIDDLQDRLTTSEKQAPITESAPPSHTQGGKEDSYLLKRPNALQEPFPGEVREMLLEILKGAHKQAIQAGQERRAAILQAILAENKPSGILAEKCKMIQSIFKGAGYSNDAQVIAALERIGIKYISGKNHSKLEYAGLRMIIAKTPSDYRASQNALHELTNRYF